MNCTHLKNAFLAKARRCYARWQLPRTRRAESAALPDAIGLLVLSVRAGLSLHDAFEQLTLIGPAPLRALFAQCVACLDQGGNMHEVARLLTNAIASSLAQELGFVLTLASTHGGQVALILTELSRHAQEHRRAVQKMHAMTMQGQIGGYIIAALPLGLLFGMYCVMPDIVTGLWRHPIGWSACALALMLQLLGIAWIRRLLHVEGEA